MAMTLIYIYLSWTIHERSWGLL